MHCSYVCTVRMCALLLGVHCFSVCVYCSYVCTVRMCALLLGCNVLVCVSTAIRGALFWCVCAHCCWGCTVLVCVRTVRLCALFVCACTLTVHTAVWGVIF